VGAREDPIPTSIGWVPRPRIAPLGPWWWNAFSRNRIPSDEGVVIGCGMLGGRPRDGLGARSLVGGKPKTQWARLRHATNKCSHSRVQDRAIDAHKAGNRRTTRHYDSAKSRLHAYG